MYNFLTLKTVRLVACGAIVFAVLCAVWTNCSLGGDAQTTVMAFMV